MRRLLLHYSVFCVLFAGHVVAATLDADVAFQIVAFAVSIQVVMFGPLGAATAPSLSLNERRQLNQVFGLGGLPLAVGLAWAYGGMAWSWPPLVLVLGAWLWMHLATDRQLRNASLAQR